MRPSLPLRLALPLLTTTLMATLVRAEDEPHRQGMDVGKTVETVRKWLGPGSAPSDKPWANALAGLTDSDPDTYAPAVRTLVVAGQSHAEAVLKDLTTIAEDPDWRVRSRVVQVLNGIGGEVAAPLTLHLSKDRESRLRELCALALGRCRGEPVLGRLLELLAAPESGIRQAAATGLTSLGDPRAISHLISYGADRDDLVKREMRQALNQLLNQPTAVDEAIHLLGNATGDRRDALLESVAITGDRRLCPALTAIAKDPGSGGTPVAGRNPSVWTQFLAVRALATCGDLRACQVLIALADGEQPSDLRNQAADTLRILTGFQAQPGRAWRIWWADHAAGIQHLEAREALIAQLHDVRTPITRDQLQAFPVDELSPLVDAVLGQPAGRLSRWFPVQAMAALRLDEPRRWVVALGTRCRALSTRDQADRVGLVLMIDDLAGPDAGAELILIAQDLEKRIEAERKSADETKTPPPNQAPLRRALTLALERRQLVYPD